MWAVNAAPGVSGLTWHLWHPAEFEVTHVGTEGEAVGSCEDGHPRTKLSMEDPGIQNPVLLCAQAWKPSSQHAGEKRGVAGLLLGRTERAAASCHFILKLKFFF